MGEVVLEVTIGYALHTSSVSRDAVLQCPPVFLGLPPKSAWQLHAVHVTMAYKHQAVICMSLLQCSYHKPCLQMIQARSLCIRCDVNKALIMSGRIISFDSTLTMPHAIFFGSAGDLMCVKKSMYFPSSANPTVLYLQQHETCANHAACCACRPVQYMQHVLPVGLCRCQIRQRSSSHWHILTLCQAPVQSIQTASCVEVYRWQSRQMQIKHANKPQLHHQVCVPPQAASCISGNVQAQAA